MYIKYVFGDNAAWLLLHHKDFGLGNVICSWERIFGTSACLCFQAAAKRDSSLIPWQQEVRHDLDVLRQQGFKFAEDTVLQQLEDLVGCLYGTPAAPLMPQNVERPPGLWSCGQGKHQEACRQRSVT